MVGKQCAGRDAKSMVTALAAPLLAGLDEVMLVDQATSRANRIAIAPTGFLEQVKRGFIGHGEDLHQGQGASFC